MEQKSRCLRLVAQPIAGTKKGGFETRPYEAFCPVQPGAHQRLRATGQAWPFSRNRSASMAAMQPEPAAVIAWR